MSEQDKADKKRNEVSLSTSMNTIRSAQGWLELEGAFGSTLGSREKEGRVDTNIAKKCPSYIYMIVVL